jgi:hypothetical protein
MNALWQFSVLRRKTLFFVFTPPSSGEKSNSSSSPVHPCQKNRILRIHGPILSEKIQFFSITFLSFAGKSISAAFRFFPSMPKSILHLRSSILGRNVQFCTFTRLSFAAKFVSQASRVFHSHHGAIPHVHGTIFLCRVRFFTLTPFSNCAGSSFSCSRRISDAEAAKQQCTVGRPFLAEQIFAELLCAGSGLRFFQHFALQFDGCIIHCQYMHVHRSLDTAGIVYSLPGSTTLPFTFTVSD